MVLPRRLKLRFCAAMALAWFALQVHAAQVFAVHVSHGGTRFVIGMHIGIDASPPAVFRALQDYSAMMRYNPDLRAVRVQRTAIPGRVLLFTTVHACVLIFCRTMHQEQIMTAVTGADGGVLEAELLPRGGDFRSGSARWTVKPCPLARSVTCLDVRIELVPAFWVPPVIGPWALRRQMAEEARRTSAGLEIVARSSSFQAARWPRTALMGR
ncbi:MAG: SRPBCC family protein [Gammaproteobacteria bacterium]|nr:SRPBCC family protein [Gammaproteobacteria bacterium]